jgi:hypothetical protein
LLLALFIALVPLPSGFVENVYSGWFYPKLQTALTALSNTTGAAFMDVLIVGGIAGAPALLFVRLRRARPGERLKALGGFAYTLVLMLALVYVSFQVLWGLNYQRKPLVTRLDYDQNRVNRDAAERLSKQTIEMLNAESLTMRAIEWPSEPEWRASLYAAFKEVTEEVSGVKAPRPAMPKTSLFDWYLGASGIAGVTNPFGHEIIIDSKLLPIEQPFTVAHEWAHLAGFGDESEASFIGLLACLRSDSSASRYSGWLVLYQSLPRLEHVGEQGIELRAEVKEDLRAIAERIRKNVNEGISNAQWRVYDNFLKANRVEEGVESYGLVVRLMLGSTFDPGWKPARRE